MIKHILLASAGLFLIVTPVSSTFGNAFSQNAESHTLAKKAPMSDDEITKEIKQEIKNDKDFAAASDIQISTQNGIVTLSGTVKDDATKKDIDGIAKGVVGDNNVIDMILVKTT